MHSGFLKNVAHVVSGILYPLFLFVFLEGYRKGEVEFTVFLGLAFNPPVVLTIAPKSGYGHDGDD